MTKIQKQADHLIHLMRQSKMDSIRSYLEEVIKDPSTHDMSTIERDVFIHHFTEMFISTSNNAPLP